MKYRLANYIETDPPKGQTFDSVVPEYGLDKKTNQLVQVGERDLIEEVQQYKDCALQAMLEKFGYDSVLQAVQQYNPNVVGVSDEPIVDDLIDDLEEFNTSMEYMEDVRERYHLSSDLSYSQILDALKQKKSEIDNLIAQHSKKGDEKDAVKVFDEETKQA